MICNFMIFSESVGSGALLSADNQGGVNLKKDLHPLFYCLKSNICVLKSVEI